MQAVSILLPAYDAAATLPACLTSIRRQTARDWECVVVDDGSIDGTRAIADAAARDDPRFRSVGTPHRGLVQALATGLACCRAPLVARMDADDLMHRDRLAAQCAALEDSSLTGVGAHVRVFPRRTLRDGFRAYEAWLNSIDSPARVAADALVECPLVHPTLIIRRPVLEAFGYRDCGWPEDYDLVLRLLAAGHRIGVVPRRLLAWRDSPGRLTRTAPDYTRNRIVALKAAALAEGLLAGTASYVLWGYGGTGRTLRRALLAHGKSPSHVVELHPGRLGNRIHGAPVVHPDALPSLRGQPVVVSVAGPVARGLIRDALAGMDFVELRDFVCAA